MKSPPLLNARAAIGLAAVLMDLDNLLDQPGILLGTRAGLVLAVEPVVITAGRNFQGGAERTDGMLGFHRVDPLKPLVGGSERMPKVFLKNVALLAQIVVFTPQLGIFDSQQIHRKQRTGRIK
jgi:hypothetical protein